MISSRRDIDNSAGTKRLSFLVFTILEILGVHVWDTLSLKACYEYLLLTFLIQVLNTFYVRSWDIPPIAKA